MSVDKSRCEIFPNETKKFSINLLEVMGDAGDIEEIPDSLTVEIKYTFIKNPPFKMGHEIKLIIFACLRDFKYLIEGLEENRKGDILTPWILFEGKRIGPANDEFVEINIDYNDYLFKPEIRSKFKASFTYSYFKFKEDIENFIKKVEKEKENRPSKFKFKEDIENFIKKVEKEKEDKPS